MLPFFMDESLSVNISASVIGRDIYFETIKSIKTKGPQPFLAKSLVFTQFY